MVTQDLGDGLVLRRATRDDAERLSAFNADIHRGHGAPAPDRAIAIWTRDLLERPHPTLHPEDFTIVEDTRTGAIVSSLNLISQTWSYAGIPFGVGRPELVGTDPAYRRRGLVRAQFDVIHRRSAERGQLVQGITGIPWYYRQFCYEYALALDGGRGGAATELPRPVDVTTEPYQIRPATADDVPLIADLDEQGRRRCLVTAVRDAAIWLHEIEGRSAGGADLLSFQVIEEVGGQPLGYLAHSASVLGDALNLAAIELRPGVPWPAVTPVVLRYLRATGERAAEQSGAGGFRTVSARLEPAHPFLQAAGVHLPRLIEPYAWYIRVPDVPAFIRQIGPVLESRLAFSAASGYTGELRLCFFRDGLRITWGAGRLTAAEPWPEASYDTCSVSFPDLTFLQLLFGHRSLAELRQTFADCVVRSDEARLVLEALFPPQQSQVRGVM